MGRLTRDVELRNTGTGKAVCNYTIAIDSSYGENKQTHFINCVAWQQQAEFLDKYFQKGSMVIVHGHMSVRTWEGKDGKKNYITEVVADEINFGESKTTQNSNGKYQNQTQNEDQNQDQAQDAFTSLEDLIDDNY